MKRESKPSLGQWSAPIFQSPNFSIFQFFNLPIPHLPNSSGQLFPTISHGSSRIFTDSHGKKEARNKSQDSQSSGETGDRRQENGLVIYQFIDSLVNQFAN